MFEFSMVDAASLHCPLDNFLYLIMSNQALFKSYWLETLNVKLLTEFHGVLNSPRILAQIMLSEQRFEFKSSYHETKAAQI